MIIMHEFKKKIRAHSGVKQFVESARSSVAYARWIFHLNKFRVEKGRRNIYKKIFINSLRKLGEPPDIFKGEDLNNKLKWLMVHDHTDAHVMLADKLYAKQYVDYKMGREISPEVYQVGTRYEHIDFDVLPSRFVLKCNHDSGSVWLVQDKSYIDHAALGEKVNSQLGTEFGVSNGEWYYSKVTPLVFAEEYLESSDPTGLADYKFHCSDGNVLCCQYIYNRRCGAAHEVMLGADGSCLGFKLDHEFVRGDKFQVPDEWQELLDTAKTLSSGKQYVRVDLYICSKGVAFGEFTWHPHNGNYKGVGQKLLGALLNLNSRSRNARRKKAVGKYAARPA